MSESRIVESISFMIGYLFLSIVFSMLNGYVLSVWLGINVVFAIIPFIIISYTVQRLQKREWIFDYKTFILLVIFVIFLPNAFYVLTDLMHINSDDFYRTIEYGVVEYRTFIEPYFLLIHIFISAVIGVYLGIKSLLLVETILRKKLQKDDFYTRNVIIVTLIILSSIGIYIGRFLRYFSWEILNPVDIISALIDQLDLFMFTFIIVMSITQYLFFYGYKLVFEKEPFK